MQNERDHPPGVIQRSEASLYRFTRSFNLWLKQSHVDDVPCIVPRDQIRDRPRLLCHFASD